MRNRIPTYPGRVKLTPVAGMANVYTMVRADEPTDEGTPLNKGTLLSDETAEKLRFAAEDDPTVDDALAFLAKSSLVFVGEEEPSGTLDARPGDLYIRQAEGKAVRIWICTSRLNDLVVWHVLAEGKLMLRTDIVTASGYWTAPTNLEGNVSVMAFGGGGGGGSGVNSGGGGGGHKKEVTTAITPGERVYITIGAGGDADSTGGTTSFGNLVSASGGAAGTVYKGGNGGSGGGGCFGYLEGADTDAPYGGNATYGGGGGAGGGVKSSAYYSANGGNGGTYGGGGGGGFASWNPIGGTARDGKYTSSAKGGAGYSSN